MINRHEKLKNTLLLWYTIAQRVTTRTSSHTNRFGTRIQGIGINYTSLSDIIITEPNAKYPTTREASSMLSRKENNCYISIVGTNPNAPQVADQDNQRIPYLHCHLSYTIFPSVEFQELVSPEREE